MFQGEQSIKGSICRFFFGEINKRQGNGILHIFSEISELKKNVFLMEMLQNGDIMWGLMKQVATGQCNWRE